VVRLRKRSKKIDNQNRHIVDLIRNLKADHPFWGYRRVWANLRFIHGLDVNKKRVLRLMRENALLVKPELRLRAKRSKIRPKPRPTRPNEWWGIDMTKVALNGVGWVYIVVVLDWYTKKIVGHYAGLQSKSWHWLLALNKGVNRQFLDGARGKGVQMMSDNGSQPTSCGFMQACAALEIKQAFTCYNNPKGNADTERVMRTLKEELIWLREWDNPVQLCEALDAWVEDYNQNYLHSTLGYMPPNKFEMLFYQVDDSPLKVA